MNNLYSKPDLQSLRMALSLTSGTYKVTRSIVNRFNEKGRPDNTQQIEYVELAIVPNGDYKVDRKEQGSWSYESFKISYVYPDYLRGEDIVSHPNYGDLKILSIDDMREYGVSTAIAIRINSVRVIRNKGEWL